MISLSSRARVQSLESAFRLQTEAADLFDIRKEPEKIRARYDISDFGRGCLMALRLVESGVRMVQIYYGNFQPWDNHDDIRVHAKLAQKTDGAVAALIDDLKARGLFDETLVVIARRIWTHTNDPKLGLGEAGLRPRS